MEPLASISPSILPYLPDLLKKKDGLEGTKWIEIKSFTRHYKFVECVINIQWVPCNLQSTTPPMKGFFSCFDVLVDIFYYYASSHHGVFGLECIIASHMVVLLTFFLSLWLEIIVVLDDYWRNATYRSTQIWKRVRNNLHFGAYLLVMAFSFARVNNIKPVQQLHEAMPWMKLDTQPTTRTYNHINTHGVIMSAVALIWKICESTQISWRSAGT